VSIADCWEGPSNLESISMQRKPSENVPTELTVTINVPHLESVKDSKLDINESNLVFEHLNLYYLDLNLKYIVNPAKGSAKHDKTRKTLTIRIPVTGLTEDS
jgi:hypothetical protein